MDVVILCGGLGKRLKSVVDDRPKPMAFVGLRPFLDILIDYIASFGTKRFILCIGHRGGSVKTYFRKRKNFQIIFSEEKNPLGTGGAIKNAKSFIETSPFLILNGDSFIKANLNNFFNFHLRKKAEISILVKKNKGVQSRSII